MRKTLHNKSVELSRKTLEENTYSLNVIPVHSNHVLTAVNVFIIYVCKEVTHCILYFSRIISLLFLSLFFNLLFSYTIVEFYILRIACGRQGLESFSGLVCEN
jgi:hypothetical protein